MKAIQIPRRFTTKNWGGTETVILETSGRLPRFGIETEIQTTQALDPIPRESMDQISITRHPYFYPYLGLDSKRREDLDTKGGNLFSFSLLGELLRAPADLFHLHTGNRLGGLARSVARLRGIPYVVTLHGGHEAIPPAERANLLAPTRGCLEWGKALGALVGSRRVLRDASLILTVSKEEARRLRKKLPKNRIEVLPNGVDLETNGDLSTVDLGEVLSGLDLRQGFDLQVGRIDEQKDPLFSLRLHAQAPDPRPLVFVGPPGRPEAVARFRAALACHPHRDRVRWIGALAPGSRTLRALFRGASSLWVPSRHEPFGIVALEAWAQGTPVLAARTGGLKELVRDHENGYSFDVGDLSGALEALTALRRDPAKGRRLGERGRDEVSQKYSWSSITKRLAKLYREVAA